MDHSMAERNNENIKDSQMGHITPKKVKKTYFFKLIVRQSNLISRWRKSIRISESLNVFVTLEREFRRTALHFRFECSIGSLGLSGQADPCSNLLTDRRLCCGTKRCGADLRLWDSGPGCGIGNRRWGGNINFSLIDKMIVMEL